MVTVIVKLQWDADAATGRSYMNRMHFIDLQSENKRK